jgi:pimeloyl-ACP methyl ester carboxylesterase
MDVIFLPGIVAPAALRYAPLLDHLQGYSVNAVVKDLEVYASDQPPADYGIETEVRGIDEAADRAGLSRFHLYGHSGGGACALAYVASRPERVLSLAVDEPAADFSDEGHADPYYEELAAAESLPDPESLAAFLRLQLADGVDPPARPPGPPPEWMAKRPAGIRAFLDALRRHHVPPEEYRRFGGSVLYTYGSLSHPHWLAMRDRLAKIFPDFTSELFEGLHHLNTSHQAEPAATAALLQSLWARAPQA